MSGICELSSPSSTPGGSSSRYPTCNAEPTPRPPETEGRPPGPTPPGTAGGRRRPIPGKGHTKSRHGCLGCKRRKVKCSEARPECSGCRRMRIVCEWPSAKGAGSEDQGDELGLQGRLSGGRAPSRGAESASREVGEVGDGEMERLRQTTSLRAALRSTGVGGPVFGTEDLRFFQHFLLDATPGLPIGGEGVWRDVARMAHEYDFLLHALLGLGASSLALTRDARLARPALSHRVRAIRALNLKLSSGGPGRSLRGADGDAAFAAIMALTFQAGHMAEGMVDFLWMVRGCHIVATQAMSSFETSAFRGLSTPEHVEGCKRMALSRGGAKGSADGRRILSETFEGFEASLGNLAPLCGSVIEVEYLAGLKQVAVLFRTESDDAYYAFAIVQNRYGEMSHKDFLLFSSPTNHAARLVLAHLFLMDYLVAVLGYGNSRGSGAVEVWGRVTLAWLEKIAAELPAELRKHAEWPLIVARRCTYGSLAGVL
ncbi:Sterol uptake control protein 2 [Colletotrichum higginsianum]|uniref:Sterol uptake control protein 2 n=1 Tax=Colletotrichum higginsianum TaxID=80884 RepID=A0A4T0VT33_9PEZI|nr:Sterol uptake control protein 2 [Colletotrichum higginsianum]